MTTTKHLSDLNNSLIATVGNKLR